MMKQQQFCDAVLATTLHSIKVPDYLTHDCRSAVVVSFLTCMKNVSLCNDQCLAGQVSVCGKNFNIVIFSDTIKYDKC